MADDAMPQYDLRPQFLCRIISVHLRAELDTDEVFAQISLIPEAEESVAASDLETAALPQLKRPVHMFSKTLTASDTSTHGGFSIHRKAAEECLPPLDMSLNPPAQELMARDLHGQEWNFRHIYRGHPKRHLLTTGWSVFVSQKRLVAGDVVIFLRAKNEELRVGIRRAQRPQANQPSSVLSSHSMHMGVVATAWHATATRTMFSIIFKPRTSPAEFIIPIEKYNKAIKNIPSIGMRFTMRCEMENTQGRRYSGTITGIGDVDPQIWRGSHWRSVKVSWDEAAIHDCPGRVSSWEIDFSTNPNPNTNPNAVQRDKRFRGHGFCTISDPSTRQIPRVGLQGKDWKRTKCDYSSSSYQAVGGDASSSGRELSTLLNSCFSSKGLPRRIDTFWQQYESEVKVSLATSSCNAAASTSGMGTPHKPRSNMELHITCPIIGGGSAVGYMESPLLAPEWLKPAVVVEASRAPLLAENNCKLFGISLTNAATMPHNAGEDGQVIACPHCTPSQVKMDNNSSTSPDQDLPSPNLASLTARSCTKVIKKGCMLGRVLDLSKLGGYNKLFAELERMFQMEGQFKNPDGWRVTYKDNEGDLLLVGDDPWQEFCELAQKIIILSAEEAQGAGLLPTKSPPEEDANARVVSSHNHANANVALL